MFFSTFPVKSPVYKEGSAESVLCANTEILFKKFSPVIEEVNWTKL